MSRRHVRKETQSSFPDDQKAKTLASAEFILLNKPNSSAFSSCCHLLCLLINMQIRKKNGFNPKNIKLLSHADMAQLRENL